MRPGKTFYIYTFVLNLLITLSLATLENPMCAYTCTIIIVRYIAECRIAVAHEDPCRADHMRSRQKPHSHALALHAYTLREKIIKNILMRLAFYNIMLTERIFYCFAFCDEVGVT